MQREFDAAIVSAASISEAVNRQGFALLRRAVPEYRVAHYRDELERLYIRHAAAPDQFVSYGPDEVSNIGRGDVSAKTFAGATGLALEDYFFHPRIDAFLDRILPRRVPVFHTFMSVSAKPGHATGGIGTHTDGIIQGDAAPITLWSALHPCGVTAPGLSVTPASQEQVIAYLRRCFPGRTIPGWASTTEWNKTSAFAADELEREFGPPWTPEMAAGDVMIFTNWTLHGSYVTPEMDGRRSAVILRWRKKPGFSTRILFKVKELSRLSNVPQ